jgi:hypothetical protein
MEFNLMFTKYDLETITIKVLNDNSTKWFNKNVLASEVSSIYQGSDEFFIGHFLFVWEKLLINTNFISVNKIDENNSIIKIKVTGEQLSENNIEKFNNFQNENKIVTIEFDISKQIHHMIKYPELYYGSKLVEQFLVKYYNFDDYLRFLEIYGDSLTPVKKMIDFNNKTNLVKKTNVINKYFLVSVFIGVLSLSYYYLFNN